MRTWHIEKLRQKIRGFVGYRSWFYRTGSIIFSDCAVLLKEGLGTYFRLRQLQRKPAANCSALSLKLRNLNYPMRLRPGTDDAVAIINNVIREEYGQLDANFLPVSLIDAGAYIGDTSAYFLSKYPNLRSVAVEPVTESYELACSNLTPYGERVAVLPFALSAQLGTCFISGGEMGARVDSSGGIEVRTTTIAELLKYFPTGRVSILKMDIEGGEDEIFRSEPEKWLPKVDCILVETHDSQVTRNVLEVLEINNWRAHRYRSLHYCRPNP